ncbi:MAG: alpha,alpha-trehalose-phosphate synthase (UDP-forming) [Actinomycetota bacterium]
MTDARRLEEVLHGRGLVIASNRGPVTFERDSEGELSPRRGAGGLVTALTHVMRQVSGTWVASAMTAVDREVVRAQGDEHFELDANGDSLRLRYLLFERETFDGYYNRISNWIFWFLMHGMWNLALAPRFDRFTREAWISYQTVNRRYAEVLAEEVAGREDSAPIMLHDYHLLLTAGFLREISPDAFIYHFIHSPWAQPDTMRILPREMAQETLEAMLSNDLIGFQTSRWAANFLRCCEDLLGAKVDWDQRSVAYGERETLVRQYPISIDVETLENLVSTEESSRWDRWVRGVVGDRKLILRIDRMELSKNIARGLHAFEELLHLYPEWRGRVVHMALLYPSRRALYEYRAYEAEVLDLADRINSQLGTDDWQPIFVLNEDNYVRALTACTSYDVLIVNPIMDGMNLVAKEGPAVNQKDGVLVLSQNAGAWQELAQGALGINPYDLSETAEAIHTALTMDPSERQRRASWLKKVVETNNPTKWMYQQLSDIRRLHEES